MFSSFIKNSATIYRNSSRSFSNNFSDKFFNTFKQFQTNLVPATPSFASAGGKSLNDAFYFTRDTGVEDTARQRQYEREMGEATKEATEKINRGDDEQIEARIKGARPDTKLGAKDAAYRQAKEHGDPSKGTSTSATRKYEEWTDPQKRPHEREWAKDAKEKAKAQGQDWAAKMENPAENQTAAKDKISMSGAAETAKEWAQSAKESVQKAAGDVNASSTLKNASETAKEWVDAAKEKSSDIGGKAKEWVDAAKEKVESANIGEKAKDWASSVKEEAADKASSWYDKAKETLESLKKKNKDK